MSRMTRITLDELLKLAHSKGYEVIMPKETIYRQDAETGSVNKLAKCRKTPKAGERAPDGVTHDTHYTMAEVLSTFDIKYGRFYEVRNRYQLQSVHAWGTTCFKKEDVERVIGLYNEEQGKNISDDWYTCFDIMKLYGLGKTQVRRFAETHGVRIRKFKGGRANYYLKADWEAARKKAEKQYFDQGKAEVRNKLIYDPYRCKWSETAIIVDRNKLSTQRNGYKTRSAYDTCFKSDF